MVENEQSFGEYLRQLIRDSGITQHKFYTELGIRKPYFYDILAGRTNPPPYPLQLSMASCFVEVVKEGRVAPSLLPCHPPLGEGTTCMFFLFILFGIDTTSP